MNGIARSRRASSPVRLTLARELGGTLDGAWWPHSATVAAELSGLVASLHRPLGEIVDIRVNWSAAEGQLDLETLVAGTRMTKVNAQPRRPRLMAVSGQRGSVKLLVVPSMTSQALGIMMLRTAAKMPTSCGAGDTRIFDTAQVVMRLAELESARWSDNVDVAQTTL